MALLLKHCRYCVCVCVCLNFLQNCLSISGMGIVDGAVKEKHCQGVIISLNFQCLWELYILFVYVLLINSFPVHLTFLSPTYSPIVWSPSISYIILLFFKMTSIYLFKPKNVLEAGFYFLNN